MEQTAIKIHYGKNMTFHGNIYGTRKATLVESVTAYEGNGVLLAYTFFYSDNIIDGTFSRHLGQTRKEKGAFSKPFGRRSLPTSAFSSRLSLFLVSHIPDIFTDCFSTSHLHTWSYLENQREPISVLNLISALKK